MKIMFALFAATILAFTLPDVLGGGNFLVDSLAKARYGFGFLAALLLAKFLFTLISYGCGVPGGFFLPLLVIGALIGSLEGELLISAGILSALYLPNIIIIAMVAFFAASIRAPITGTLLILEMTGDFHHLTALALASAVAYVTAELLKGQPIYDSLLKKIPVQWFYARFRRRKKYSGSSRGQRFHPRKPDSGGNPPSVSHGTRQYQKAGGRYDSRP